MKDILSLVRSRFLETCWHLRFLYNRLITHYFGIEWRFPILWFGIVVAFIFISAIVSVYAPAKRIRNMPITATINEL